MKKYLLWILILVFVLLIAGAVLLYNHLSEANAPALPLPSAQKTESPAATAAPAPTQEATPAPAATQAPAEEERPVVPAPDILLQDMAGNQVQLSQLLGGKPTVMNFWTTWCTYCEQELPDFDVVYQELGDKVNFIMINATNDRGESVEAATAYFEKQGVSLPAYFDIQQEGVTTYGIRSYPTTFFIDAEGNLFTYAPGMIDREILLEVLTAMGVETE